MKPKILVLLTSTAIAFSSSPAIAQKSAQRLFCEGWIYQKGGQWNEAVIAYSQAIKLNPRYAEGYFFRGVSHHLKGNHVAAIENYNQALLLGYPRRDLIYRNRGNAFGVLGDYKQALEDTKLALSVNHDFINYRSYALANFMTGNRQTAVRLFQESAERYYGHEDENFYLVSQNMARIVRTAPANKIPTGIYWLPFPSFSNPQTRCP